MNNTTLQKTLLVATRNLKKQNELQDLLSNSGWTVVTLRDFPNCPEVEEDEPTFLGNASKKAITASLHSGLLTLADDSGLEVDALNSRPGIYSARYANGENSTDEENLHKVLEEMRGIEDHRRSARFVCAAVIANGEEIVFSTQQTVAGIITHDKHGEGGFGYDPIFYYPPFQKTFAEVPIDKKHKVSHRGKAMNDIVGFLINSELE